jgi:hypothetical protein
MNIRQALQSEHSKAKTMEIVRYVGNNPERFGEVVALVTGDESLLAQRAAWAIQP